MSNARPDGPGSNVDPRVRALFAGLFDYAGLFPPAGLGMADTVRNYLAYRGGPQGWMLGRLIVPWSRRMEFLEALSVADPCRVSLLLALPASSDAVDRLRAEHAEFAGEAAGRVEVGAVETKVAGVVGLDALGATVDLLTDLFPDAEVHAEATDSCEVGALLNTLAELRARTGRGAGKLRTGSVVPDEIPPVEDVARFIRECADRNLPWKATAGLHHPLPATRPLTYEPDAPRGPMLGYLGVILATARALADPDLPAGELRSLLTDPRPPDLERFPAASISTARTNGCLSIGSCSFVEPLEGAEALSLLPRSPVPTRTRTPTDT